MRQPFFYVLQFALIVLGTKVDSTMKSGALDLQRGLSSGKQDFDTDKNEWPIYQPVIKVEARAQCSGKVHRVFNIKNKVHSCLHIAGEAKYIVDIPYLSNELHGAFVVSTIGSCQIDSIDASKALVNRTL